jgi:hypothetical protein
MVSINRLASYNYTQLLEALRPRSPAGAKMRKSLSSVPLKSVFTISRGDRLSCCSRRGLGKSGRRIFFAYLTSRAATKIFLEQGFEVLSK